jgi:Mn-dependent DtxR family transcriptional regulator
MNRINLRKKAIKEILPGVGQEVMSTSDIAKALKINHYTALGTLAEMYMDGEIRMIKFKRSRYWSQKLEDLEL